MPSYIIYLTKSSQAIYAIARGYTCDKNVNGIKIKDVQCSSVDGRDLIPAIYHDKGYYFCAAELETPDGCEAKYELIIC